MGNHQTSSLAFVAAVALAGLALAPTSGCSSKSNGSSAGGDDAGEGLNGSSGGTMSFGGNEDAGGISKTCPGGTNFQCQKVVCPGGGTTSLSGIVYDPAGKIPLFNVSVYVPNITPGPLPQGASCADCSSWYTAPVVSAITDEGGNFTIKDMPVGPKIPLVVQVGKWRMQYTLSNVAQCTNNDAATLTGAKLRMPRNHTEGDIPNIAVSTGAADSLECLLLRMGVDNGEYTGDPKGAGRIHIFTGGDAPDGRGGAVTNPPTSPQSYTELWNRDDSMTPFDLVLLSCEGSPTSYLNQAGQQVLYDYTNSGGRVFASHYHFAWFIDGMTGPTPFDVTPPLATWQNTTNSAIVGDGTSAYNADIVTTLPNGMVFPEGASLKKWLQNTGALTNGQLPLYYSRNNANVTMANTHSQAWVTLDPSTPAPNATQYFSFDTPIGQAATEQCGRVVYSDLHVSGGANQQAEPNIAPDYPNFTSGGIVPDGCDMHDLTPQEKALEFMIFDLSSCLTPVGQPSVPPTPQ
jgi:hypothetical protein